MFDFEGQVINLAQAEFSCLTFNGLRQKPRKCVK